MCIKCVTYFIFKCLESYNTFDLIFKVEFRMENYTETNGGQFDPQHKSRNKFVQPFQNMSTYQHFACSFMTLNMNTLQNVKKK